MFTPDGRSGKFWLKYTLKDMSIKRFPNNKVLYSFLSFLSGLCVIMKRLTMTRVLVIGFVRGTRGLFVVVKNKTKDK